MKKVFLGIFTLLAAMGFFTGSSVFFKEEKEVATISTMALSVADINVLLNVDIYVPQSLVYVGNDTLIIADMEAIKKKNISTGAVETLISIGDDVGEIPFSDQLSFDAKTNDIYIKEFSRTGNRNVVRKYNLDNPTVPTVVQEGIVIPSFNAPLKDYFGNAINNPSNDGYPVTIDNYNGVLYYIKEDSTKETIIRHETATVKHPAEVMWTFAGRENEHFDWANENAIVGRERIYRKTSKETILYEFPFSVNSVAKIGINANVISLNNEVSFDGMTAEFNDWVYVLYDAMGGIKTGYILKADAPELPQSEYATVDLAGQTATEDVEFESADTYYGRVIRNNVPIYKYPTSVDLNLVYDEQLPKTEVRRENETAVLIERLITIPDIRPWYYFEIKVIDPATDAFKYYGYVPTNYVIDINAGSEFLRVVDNAKISAKPGLQVKIYSDKGLTKEIEGEYLIDGMRVRAINYNNSSRWTEIVYSDPIIGEWHQIRGFVATGYVAPDSLTASQWAGIIIFSVMLLGGAIFLIWCLVPKKKKKTKAAKTEAKK